MNRGSKMERLNVEKYVTENSSEWIVFLHGFGGNTKMWNRQIRFFKDRYNLLVIDLPGHGLSKPGIANKGIRKFEEIADMIVYEMRENGIEKAFFICVSLGTLVLGGILSKYKEVVKGAILCGAIMGINIFLKLLLRALNVIKRIFPYMFIMELFSRFLLPFKAHQFSRKLFMKSGVLLGKEEFLAWCNLVIADLDVLKNLTDWADNILFVTGEEDYTFKKGVQKKVNSLHMGSLQIVKQCGHVCNVQKWREFNDISLNFLQSVA